MKNETNNSIGRIVIAALSVLIQIIWIVTQVWKLNAYYIYISWIIQIIAVLLVLRIYTKSEYSTIKTPWMILLLVIPLVGVCIYLLFGKPGIHGTIKKRFYRAWNTVKDTLHQDKQVLFDLKELSPTIGNQTGYTWRYGGYPVYYNTDVTFYSEASEAIEAQKEELRKAKHFIFMEYHAIEDSVSFHAIEEILIEKVKEGVEVRLFYDDVGSVGFLSKPFVKRMLAQGIQCRVFNPILPVLNVFMNNRDHRKITVIDGKVGFTGGYNLADEYFNIIHPYGYWKDTGIKLVGDAVRSLTAIFLENWNSMKNVKQDIAAYFPTVEYVAQDPAYVQPYSNSPLKKEHLAENIYLNMIKSATKYLYITTPYLILDEVMSAELGLAAKRGVDVRIVTPGIPDKKLVFKMTRSYYAGLVKEGVRIYEYTPGFMHSKQFLCDNESAIVGTINLDYRSMYLNFENATYIYGGSAIQAIKEDFEQLFPVCEEVTRQYGQPKYAKIPLTQCLLRLFAPLV